MSLANEIREKSTDGGSRSVTSKQKIVVRNFGQVISTIKDDNEEEEEDDETNQEERPLIDFDYDEDDYVEDQESYDLRSNVPKVKAS